MEIFAYRCHMDTLGGKGLKASNQLTSPHFLHANIAKSFENIAGNFAAFAKH